MNQGLARTLVEAHEPALDQVKALEVRHHRDLQTVLSNARKRVAPLWPLESFVAVNPFLGLSGERFESACQTLSRVAGASMLMPREQYRAWIAEGRITSEDLEQALSLSRAVEGAPQTPEALHAALADTPSYQSAVFQTVADVCDGGSEGESNRRVLEDISKWCAAYWDDGQSAWQMPWRHLPLYQ
ncbi:MAG: putative inorganic carbon transporter subunit DabA, partial [Polyangiales bacterium]